MIWQKMDDGLKFPHLHSDYWSRVLVIGRFRIVFESFLCWSFLKAGKFENYALGSWAALHTGPKPTNRKDDDESKIVKAPQGFSVPENPKLPSDCIWRF